MEKSGQIASALELIIAALGACLSSISHLGEGGWRCGEFDSLDSHGHRTNKKSKESLWHNMIFARRHLIQSHVAPHGSARTKESKRT